MSRTEEKSVVVYESRTHWFNNLLRKLGLISISEKEADGNASDSSESSGSEEVSAKTESIFDDEESCDKYLKTLDPKDWKDQDHYRVLGLSKRRIDATDSEIKKSYRKMVLRHHPDKQGQQNIDLNCHYFSCITKAHEILSDQTKRRSYDSVDPTFDDTIANPTPYNKNRFFEIFGPIFKRNARWSNKQPVPDLGGEDSTFDEVNSFYDFWYNFDSWREYSYLDEEEKEKGENREHRRYLDKVNQKARNQRKKEEMQRIRQLVDNAYQCDPRVAKFREEEKRRKQEAKKAKQASIKAKKDEEERILREKEERELALKKKLEDEQKQKKEEERKRKEALKKQMRKETKLIEAIMGGHNYFTDDATIKIEYMKELDKLCKIFTLEKLTEFREALEKASDVEAKKTYFLAQVEELNKNLDSERVKLATTHTSSSSSSNTASSKKVWSYNDVQLIIKAVKIFPAGTPSRWTVIANYINDKTDSGITRNHRDVLEKAKELQQSNESQELKEETNKNAFKKLEIISTANPVNVESAPSQRYDAPSSHLDVNDSPWTNEEQQLLEQAMKTYPASSGSERWDLIADCIPNRSRADCIKRYKYLVDLVKAKKAAKTKK